MSSFFNLMLPSSIALATIFLFGCIGEIIMEKAGHLNLGVPGVMSMGTFGGCLGVSIVMSWYKTNPSSANWFLLILFGLLFSALMSSLAAGIYGLLTVTFRCNQNITGLALTIFGAGFTNFFMETIDKTYFSYASKIIRYSLPFASNLGAFGKIFFSHGILVYLSIAVAILTSFVLNKTRVGLSLRAIGENPSTADAAGINIVKYKYLAILIGSIIAGYGGFFYVMDYVGGSWENAATIQEFGWLAIALVIFTVWKPSLAIIGSILFGFLYSVPSFLSVSFVMKKVFFLLPYVVTIVVLVVTSVIGKKNVQPPEALGQSYFREDR